MLSEVYSPFVNLSGIAIKRLVVLLIALSLVAAPTHAATKKPTVKPSPKAAWPPKGFKANAGIYAKIPTAVELIGIVSNNKTLTGQLAQKVGGVRICEKYSCGVIQLASVTGCVWWEVTANVVGQVSATDKTKKTFGTIRTTLNQTKAKTILTALLISEEILNSKNVISNIAASCHQEATTEKIPSNTYQPATS